MEGYLGTTDVTDKWPMTPYWTKLRVDLDTLKLEAE
jgi:hypothetical protein